MESKALVPFKVPFRFGVLGPFSPAGFPNKTNILKLEQLNYQMSFCICRRPDRNTRWEIEHSMLFFVFLAAGLVDLGPESLNFSNSPKTVKQIQPYYPNMTSRLGQHLRRAKSKAGNFGLFALYPCYFFICCLAGP